MDNQNDQTTGLTVTITSATNGPAPITFTAADYVAGDGFDVAGGQIGNVDIFYQVLLRGLLASNAYMFGLANYANPNGLYPIYYDQNTNFYNDNLTASSTVLVFTPISSGSASASVPGPLPLLGAGAAFGWSRRLRRRIKATA